jgi:hypothetical protein
MCRLLLKRVGFTEHVSVITGICAGHLPEHVSVIVGTFVGYHWNMCRLLSEHSYVAYSAS